MANEISLPIGESGLTGLYCRTLQGVTLGSPMPLAEVPGAGGVYVGTMAGEPGHYVLLAYDSTDKSIASSTASYQWDGEAFLPSGGFGDGDRASLTATKTAAEAAQIASESNQKNLNADERIRADRYQKLEVGTDTVILDKDVTKNGDNIDLVEHV